MTNFLAIVVIIGIGTYLFRLSFIAIFGRSGVPSWLEAPLRYVAPAVLAAIVAPAVIAPEGTIEMLPATNPKVLAATVASLVALRTKSVAWTIVVGMGALWVLQALF